MSGPRDDRERRRVAAEDAAAWIAHLDTERLTQVERGALVDWLRESPVNVAEFLRVGRVGLALGHLERWYETDASQSDAYDNVVSIEPQRSRSSSQRQPPRRLALRLGLTAAVIAIGLLSWSLVRQDGVHRLRTNQSERLEFTLDDGSIVRLSPATDVRVKMRATERSIFLDRGEAVFRVAKDESRPFVVQAARTRVEAIGTVFTVARMAAAVVVTVSEGRVRVLPSAPGIGSAPSQPLALDANQRVRLSAGGEIAEILRLQSDTEPKWEMLELAFDEVTVRELAQWFNRRNGLQIRIDDETLAQRRVSGFFDPDDPQSFVQFLEVVAGARAARSDTGEIVVTGPPEHRR